MVAMTWDLRDWYDQWRRIKMRSGNAGRSYVRNKSKKLLRALAWHTPISDPKFHPRGRARAGWWPAAKTLGVSTVYSGYAQDKGEGSCVDQSSSETPTIVMTNSVPYIQEIKTDPGWPQKAFEQEARNAQEDILRQYREKLLPWIA